MKAEAQRYTLGEAAEILRRERCRTHGHDWEIICQGIERRPVQLVCGNCGRSYRVVEQ